MYACYGSYTATPTTIRFKSEKLKTPYKMLATPIHLNLHRSCTQPRPPNYPRTQTAPKEWNNPHTDANSKQRKLHHSIWQQPLESFKRKEKKRSTSPT